jgi:hypothetical protein
MKISKFSILKENWKKPIWWRDVFLFKVISPIISWFNRGNSIFEEEWDHLIILDACRCDMFKKIVRQMGLKGKLEYRNSMGGNTFSFIYNNLRKIKYNYQNDIIYITANPAVSATLDHISKKIQKKFFYKIIDIWKDYWDEKYHTVLPSTLYHCSLIIHKLYPNKRLIIHFLQPHFPYLKNPSIGEMEIEKSREDAKKKRVGYGHFVPKDFFVITSVEFYTTIPSDIQLKLYEENLKIVLSWVKKLVEKLPGKKVITTDHSELFGERFLIFKVYGHPKVQIPFLTKVPWLIIE